MSFAKKVGVVTSVGSLLPTGPRLAATEFTNTTERLQQKARTDYYGQTPKSGPPADIDFALLSTKAYATDPRVPGFQIIPELSSPDRVVYQHDRTKHVVISFRGTNLKNPRDLLTDALLAMGNEEISHRFYNAEQITQKVIARYGKENVTVTGHSLGGSQAMHVSKKYKVHAEVYNPHITWQNSITGTNYPDVILHVNKYDPVAAFHRGAYFQKVDMKNSKSHSINNFIRSPDVSTGPSSLHKRRHERLKTQS